MRGKKFVSLPGVNYCSHRGTAYAKRDEGFMRFDLQGRIILDPERFAQLNPSRRVQLESTKYVIKSTRDSHYSTRRIITEEDRLIASPVVLGFSISRKCWLEFSLTSVEHVEWNSRAFDRVVLPTHVKQHLQDLIVSHSAAVSLLPYNRPTAYRGTGLNIALHGPTGAGKTLAAEGIAEQLKRPLYVINTGELVTDGEFFEQTFIEILDLTSRWNAILLLEDADVFVEARQPHDYHRNAIVSVFLRCMDLHHGTLFLTTRCLEVLDDAFQSRLHLGVDCDTVAAQEREEIWQHHIRDLDFTEVTEKYVLRLGAVLSKTDFEELGKKILTGRQVRLHIESKPLLTRIQIKHVVWVSQCTAKAADRPLNMDIIKQVLADFLDFGDGMRGGKGYRDAMRQYT
jgi:SpoVK/Ycf46/Vps4 family AAA+-type ATPase